jgi:hypothetical protein
VDKCLSTARRTLGEVYGGVYDRVAVSRLTAIVDVLMGYNFGGVLLYRSPLQYPGNITAQCYILGQWLPKTAAFDAVFDPRCTA